MGSIGPRANFHTMELQPQPQPEWYFNFGATNHITCNAISSYERASVEWFEYLCSV